MYDNEIITIKKSKKITFTLMNFLPREIIINHCYPYLSMKSIILLSSSLKPLRQVFINHFKDILNIKILDEPDEEVYRSFKIYAQKISNELYFDYNTIGLKEIFCHGLHDLDHIDKKMFDFLLSNIYHPLTDYTFNSLEIKLTSLLAIKDYKKLHLLLVNNRVRRYCSAFSQKTPFSILDNYIQNMIKNPDKEDIIEFLTEFKVVSRYLKTPSTLKRKNFMDDVINILKRKQVYQLAILANISYDQIYDKDREIFYWYGYYDTKFYHNKICITIRKLSKLSSDQKAMYNLGKAMYTSKYYKCNKIEDDNLYSFISQILVKYTKINSYDELKINVIKNILCYFASNEDRLIDIMTDTRKTAMRNIICSCIDLIANSDVKLEFTDGYDYICRSLVKVDRKRILKLIVFGSDNYICFNFFRFPIIDMDRDPIEEFNYDIALYNNLNNRKNYYKFLTIMKEVDYTFMKSDYYDNFIYSLNLPIVLIKYLREKICLVDMVLDVHTKKE